MTGENSGNKSGDKTGVSGLSSAFIQGAPIQPVGRRVGEVVFPPEAFVILKKMDLLRLERNTKREERRKAGEENVTDDEGDDLTPYIMVAPSGENAQPSGDPVPPTHSADASSESGLLFDDQVAEKNSFRANDDTIPAAIASLAKNGISPPLTLFLPASLERIRSSNVKTVKHGTGETTKVTVLDVSDFPGEDTLSQANFFTCYNTFLSFLEPIAGPSIFQGFAQHYNVILKDGELDIWFPAFQAFDKKIRAQFFTKPYIVDITNDEYRTALQSAKNIFMHNNRPSSGSQSSPKAPSGSSYAGRERSRPAPYDKDRESRNREREFRTKNTLCFRCGRMGHGGSNCAELNPSKHGREFTVYVNREGLFRVCDDRAVCMRFNIGNCDSTSRNHPIHICSLCGDSHHGANSCTRN
ncbi:hypothetical protein C8J57DRAFT_1184128 [Mycena rebaudengoi]|nr:hypothetical protein C8J57DRAFT_1184128 [Mycena rebaudengoi]